MTTINLNVSSTAVKGFGDTLLAPLQWCGNQWQHLHIKENSQGIEKIYQFAKTTIQGALLTIATVLAIVPGIIGNFIKPLITTYKEDWAITLKDTQLKENCKKMLNESNTDISNIVVTNIMPYSTFISSVYVETSNYDKIITLYTQRHAFKNLTDCFHQDIHQDITDEENLTAVQGLFDLILGVNNETQALLRKKLALSSKIEFQASKNLEDMHLFIYDY